MRNIFVKYKSLVKDEQWYTKSEKDVEILSLTIQIQELNILFPKQSASQESNKNNNGDNKRKNNIGSSWKKIPLTSVKS